MKMDYNNLEYFFDDIDICENIGNFEDEYVYDVEVDDDTHTFIANDILVHNSIFVCFDAAINSCDWKNLVLNKDMLEKVNKPFIILNCNNEFQIPTFNNSNHLGTFTHASDINVEGYEILIVEGKSVHDRDDWKFISGLKDIRVMFDWNRELDFIMGLDKVKYADYFKECLENHAASYGVENKEDFELERISESVINIAKKKYIQNIVFEDGIPYDRLTYVFPKGVELVRRSTPAFAREKIVEILKYLFSHPDSFNIKDLLKLVKNLRKEFELAPIDDISMQSSCSNYEDKVISDKDKLLFVNGAHFAVKCSAHHNYLLHKNTQYQNKYEFIKSGDKIKYYYCNSSTADIFAFKRGSFPTEFAPPVNMDVQFFKSILSPINGIIEPLGMPEITKRLSVVVDIFGGI